MTPLIRTEYLDAAIALTEDKAQTTALALMREQAAFIGTEEVRVFNQCIANRLAAGENPKRIPAPRGINDAANKAMEDIHKMELRKCRRAKKPAEIVESLSQLLKNDIEFSKPNKKLIDLAANFELADGLHKKKIELQSSFQDFLTKWP